MPYFSLLGQRRYHRAKFGSGERKQKVIDSDMHVILSGRDEHVKDIVTAPYLVIHLQQSVPIKTYKRYPYLFQI